MGRRLTPDHVACRELRQSYFAIEADEHHMTLFSFSNRVRARWAAGTVSGAVG
jgi:hypothetical protein